MRGVLGRLWPVAALAVAVAMTVTGLAVYPEDTTAEPSAGQVIVAGVAGLRWEDVDQRRTPHLWQLAQTGSIGSLSVRSANRPTCAADGWVTLGAGNWAAGTTQRPAGPCQPLQVSIESTGGAGAHLPGQEQLVRFNQWDLPWGAVPGALAGSVGCTVAVGDGAAVAAARSYGRVDRYAPALPDDPGEAAALLADHCELAIVDLGSAAGPQSSRRAGAALADAALGRLLAARPPESLLLVVGVADTDNDPHLHVAVADGPHLPPGWLTSATTGRTGYLQLVDIAPTVLAALDRPAPQVRLAGHPAGSRPGRPDDLAQAVSRLVAADQEASLARPVSSWFLAGLTLAQLVLLAAVVPLLRRPPLPGLTIGRPPRWQPVRWWRAAAPVLLVAAALAIPAALAASGLPWWRADAAGGAFTLSSLAVLAAASVLVVRTPLFRSTLGLVGAGAAVAAAAVAVDLLTGSWLQLNSVLGYLAHDGGRFAGVSDTGLGVLIAGTLLLAGCLAEQVPRHRRAAVMVLVGSLGVVLAGSPFLGNEMGGAVALVAGLATAAALCTGRWVNAGRMAVAVSLAVAVVVAVAGFELRRPVEQRTGLGSMLAQFAEGTSGSGLQRVSLSNVEAFTSSPLTVLAVGAGAFLWFALLRPWGGLRRLYGIHPGLRAAMVGAVVASLTGGVLVGAALTVAGAAAAVGVPLLTLASLRLRERSAGRFEVVGRVRHEPAQRGQRQVLE